MTTRYWNAGESGCGSLILGLKRQFDRIGPGEVLHVTAANAGAPADLPSWCRVTGHELVEADHPIYVIRKKSN